MKTYEIHTVSGKVMKIQAASAVFAPSGRYIHFYGEKKAHIASFFAANVVAVITVG